MTKQLTPKIKREIINWVLATVSALALAFGLYWGGTALGAGVLQLQKDYRIELFNQVNAQQGNVVKILSNRQSKEITAKYLEALADAAIRFEFFPQKDDATAFFEVLSLLPGKVNIDKFQFAGHDLTIFCSADLSEPLIEYKKALDSSPAFKSATIELTAPTGESSFQAEIHCTAL